MSALTLVVETWNAVKESIISSDRGVVADNVVSLLIDHDIAHDEIRRAFRGEGDIIDALKYYIDNDEKWDETAEEDDDDELEYRYDDEDDDESEDW